LNIKVKTAREQRIFWSSYLPINQSINQPTYLPIYLWNLYSITSR